MNIVHITNDTQKHATVFSTVFFDVLFSCRQGQVYKATMNGKPVAVKVQRPDVGSSDGHEKNNAERNMVKDCHNNGIACLNMFRFILFTTFEI